MTKIHQSTIELADEYAVQKKKHIYIALIMFASMFNLFSGFLDRKNNSIEVERNKYQ